MARRVRQPDREVRERVRRSRFGILWEDLFPEGRDVRSGLAHGFGRVADIVRGQRTSVTAIEREEEAKRKLARRRRQAE
jgi:hypothetical protein